MSHKSSVISTAVKHPIASLAVSGFAVYAGYWSIQQVHWMVSHAFVLLLYAALIGVALTVSRKVRGSASVSGVASHISTAGALGAADPVTDWDRLVREYELPQR